MGKDFFISFRGNLPDKKDNSIRNIVARDIHRELKRKMYSHYYNPQNPTIEKEYAYRLEKNVRECKVFVWILTGDCLHVRKSKNKSHQDWYMAEILWAAKYGKPILPVVHKESYQFITKKNIAEQFYTAFESLLEYGVFDEVDREVVNDFVSHLCDGDMESTDPCRLGGYHKLTIEKSNAVQKNRDSHKKNDKLFDVEKKNIQKVVKEIVTATKNTEKIFIHRYTLRIFQGLLIVFLMVAIFGGIQFYQRYAHSLTVWDGSITVKGGWASFKGNGSKEDPYQIETATQLAWFSYYSQYDDYKGKYFELEKDITLNPYNSRGTKNDVEQYVNTNGDGQSWVIDPDETHIWTPIGNEKHPFAGVFNGNGHIIYGILINSDSDYQGLFGLCSAESRISNINVVCATVDSTASYIGAIAGKTDGIIDKCSVYSVFCSGKDYVGGIAGKAETIVNSFANSWMSAVLAELVRDNVYRYVGGAAGECDYLINSSGSSIIDVGGVSIGGLVGNLKFDAYNCVELGTYISDFSTGYYIEHDEPITVCSVFGACLGIDNTAMKRNIFYNPNSEFSFGVNKSMYEQLQSLQKKYQEYFGDIEYNQEFKEFIDGDGNKIMPIYADYDSESKKYNMISVTGSFNQSMVEELNDGLGLIESSVDSPIYQVLKKYGVDGKILELSTWEESENSQGIFDTLKSSPWLSNVSGIREKWDD